MENDPAKWTDQRWSIPGNWFQLVRHVDKWWIESEAGFRLAINSTDAERTAEELNIYSRKEWERELKEREQRQ